MRIYNIRDLPVKEREKERRGDKSSWEVRGVGNSHPRTRSPFPLVLYSQLLFDHRTFLDKPLSHQSPTSKPTLYKFIVMGLLGLDPVCHWARSKNHDPTSILKKKKKKTLVSLKNKSCSLDLEQKELLVMTNRALIFLPQIIGLLALFNVETQPKTKKGIRQKQN